MKRGRSSRREPHASVYTLTDVTGSRVTSAIRNALHELTKANKPYVVAGAVVGVTAIQSVILRGIVQVTRSTARGKEHARRGDGMAGERGEGRVESVKLGKMLVIASAWVALGAVWAQALSPRTSGDGDCRRRSCAPALLVLPEVEREADQECGLRSRNAERDHDGGSQRERLVDDEARAGIELAVVQ